MNEVRTALRRMGYYYLLLAVGIIPCANVIPDTFPIRNFSTAYLLVISSCLVLYYSHRVSPSGGLSKMMKSLSWMGLLMILLRGIKYSAFSEVGVLARHTWYLYYAPLLLLPLFFFYISLFVSAKDTDRIPPKWYWTLALTLVFIALVLTNDLHRLVFDFLPGYANWDNEYSHGLLFYVITAWQYALYLAAIIILIVKCRVVSSKKNSWIIMIPFVAGIAMNVLLLTGTMPKIGGSYIIEFPEAIIFTAAAVLECCMQLGLIPTNTDYGKLFRQFSISAQITDQKGTAVYSSRSATPLTPEQFGLPNVARIGEHTVLRKMKIPGGYGFWQEDMTELDRLNDELAEAKEELAQEAELIRLRSELKEKQTKIEQRTLVYDTIAKRTLAQSQAITRLAEDARASNDAAYKKECSIRITLLGAYIKRYANLMLISRENNVLELGELALAFSEILRYLNYCGIPGELINAAECTVPAEAALGAFEAFETLISANHECLRGVFASISENGGVKLKLALENLSVPLPEELAARLASFGVKTDFQTEDGIAYICFTLPKGGGGV